MAEVNKDTVDKKASAKMLSEIGQTGLRTHNTFVEEIAEKDLSIPNRWYTFDEMTLHSAISEPLNLGTALETNAVTEGYFESTGSNLSKALAEYGNYVIHNMSRQSWFEVVNNFNSHMKNGFSLNEIVATRAKSGKYKGDIVLDSINPRSPKSIYAWVWDENKRHVTHVIQKPLETENFKLKSTTSSYVGSYTTGITTQGLTTKLGKMPVLDLRRCVHNIYNPSMNDPMGQSPLLAGYKPWREVSVIGEYEIIGTARNFGGTPIARVPNDLLINAANPQEYPDDYKSLEDIKHKLEAAHRGDNPFFILPSGRDDGAYEWDLKLLGIDGGNTGFDLDGMIKRKTTEIYNSFNAGHLILGQNGNTTSYSAAESGTATHSTIIERDLKGTCYNIEKMLASLLDAAGFVYDKRDLPRFRPAAFDQLSLDELGKFIQRVMSVNGMTPEMMETLLKWGNLPSSGLDMIDFYAERESGAGKGMGTSGAGSNNQSNSDTNMENKSLHGEPLNVFKGEDGIYYDLDT